MKEGKVIYEKETGTIRQMPENYLLAYKHFHKGYWICDPDFAADWKIVKKLFRIIFFSHEIRWEYTGEALIKRFYNV